MNNALKHAGARAIQVIVASEPGIVALEVRDDGAGFDPRSDFPGHLGLRSMRERVEQLGGELLVDSAPGHGTRLGAHVPTLPGSPRAR